MVLEIMLTVMLYQLFKSFSTTGMTIATYSRLAMAIIMGKNLINYMIPAIIMTQPEYLSSFSSTELESLTFFLRRISMVIWTGKFSLLFTFSCLVM